MGALIVTLLVLLVLAWLVGALNVRRAKFGFVLGILAWLSAWCGVIHFMLQYDTGDPFWGLVGLAICFVSLIMIPVVGLASAFIAGVKEEPSPNPPAKQVYEAYRSLPEEDQERVRRGLAVCASVGSGLLADWMAKRGKHNAARALNAVAERNQG